TDQPLNGVYRVFWIGNTLALGGLPDQDLTIVGEGDHGRRGAAALGIFDDLGLVSFHHGNARVGGAEIDTNCLRHDKAPCLEMRINRFRSIEATRRSVHERNGIWRRFRLSSYLRS